MYSLDRPALRLSRLVPAHIRSIYAGACCKSGSQTQRERVANKEGARVFEVVEADESSVARRVWGNGRLELAIPAECALQRGRYQWACDLVDIRVRRGGRWQVVTRHYRFAELL